MSFMARTKSLRLPGGFKTIAVLLVLGIVVMVMIWRPWQATIKASDRTISVTGNATVTATPDQYAFSPSYSFMNTDKQTALNDLTAKSNEIVNQLKNLGVASSDIKTNASGYGNNGIYLPNLPVSDNNTYTLSLEITVHNLNLVQKVQDYLVTTSPTGEVSPTASFSTAMQQTLQTKAREKAEQDARAQADQSAKNLGFKIGPVKSVTDGSLDTGGPIAFGDVVNPAVGTSTTAQLNVQPGQNDLSYSVSVVYYIR